MIRTVALSSQDAEYMALSDASREVIFLRQVLACIGFEIEPTALFGDNNGSIALAQNPCDHQKSKHMQVRYHFIRQKVTEKVLSIRKVDTLRQLADLCTKALTANQHWELTRWVCGLAIT